MRPENKNLKISWTNTSFLLGIPILFIALAPYVVAQGIYFWGFFLYAFVHYLMEGIAITGGYHRLFSHRAYESHPVLKVFYLVLGAGAFQNSALKWSFDHRIHHRECDTDEDPYNINKGFFWAHMGWIFYSDNRFQWDKVPADLKKDKLILWQHKNYLLIALASGVLLPVAFGHFLLGSALGGFVWGVLLRVLFTSHCTYFINSLAHVAGSRTYNLKNSARDNWLLSFVSFGEGFHNFHHKFQADYRNGIRWFQWDPTKWLVKLLSYVGIAKNLNETPQEKIIAAKILVKEELLLNKGVDTSPLQAYRLKLVRYHENLAELRREYKLLKSQKTKQARVAVKQMQRKIKIARKEFLNAHKDWQVQFKLLQANMI
jgi:stearoyl-CoA desaturase (delta-9 desaturase)